MSEQDRKVYRCGILMPWRHYNLLNVNFIKIPLPKFHVENVQTGLYNKIIDNSKLLHTKVITYWNYDISKLSQYEVMKYQNCDQSCDIPKLCHTEVVPNWSCDIPKLWHTEVMTYQSYDIPKLSNIKVITYQSYEIPKL